VRGKPFQRGPDPRRRPGRKGRSGRKPDAFYLACAGLADGPVLSKISEYLTRGDASPTEPAWRWCAEYVTEHCYSKRAPGADPSVEVHQHDDIDAHALLLERLNTMSENLAAAGDHTVPPTPPRAGALPPTPNCDPRPSSNGSEESGPARVRRRIP
jgi:hypothetical protein